MPAGSGERMTKNFNAHVVIFSLAAVLALATASECHSITHLPSLLYGAVLWGWWALIASILWRVGQKISLCAEPFPSVDLHSCVGGYCAGRRASAALGSLGFTDAGWRGDGNCALGLDEPAQYQSSWHGVVALRFPFRDHGSDPVTDSRATRGHAVALAAKATLCRASASVADATGAAFPLQYFERDHDAGGTGQAKAGGRRC